MRQAKARKCSPSRTEGQQDGGQALAIAGEAAVAGGPGETTLDDPSFGEQDDTALRLWGLDEDHLHPVLSGAGGRLRASGARIDEGDLHLLTRHRLPLRRQRLDQRLDRERRLGALAAVGATLAGATPALGGRVQHPRIQHHRRGLRLAAFERPQQQARLLDHLDQRLKTAGRQPATDRRTRPRPRAGSRWAASATARRCAPESARR